MQKTGKMPAETFKATVIDKIKRTPTIESIRFKVEGDISFIPGQFLQLIFDEGNMNNRGLNKYLSFSSSPTKDYIEVTKRLSDSDFSRKLKELSIGDTVAFRGPLGKCVFKEEYKKISFLIGGIGITPVISILEYIVERSLNTDAVLFYSNRVEEEIAFKGQLDGWIEENKNIKVIYSITDCQPKDKTCIAGRITEETIIKTIDDFSQRIIFIFGPPKMVAAMEKLCLGIDCKKENIKIENFVGY